MAGMTAKFNAAVRYAVTAQCVTPLRTGGADGQPDVVLRRWDGRALVQAASLAGAFREWLTKERGPQLAETLFGSQERGGHLVLSNGEFEDAAQQQLRPRVSLDETTGTADEGKKFDVAHIARDCSFTFELIWMGDMADQTEETAAIESILAALHQGHILLGAQKSNGFGRVKLTKVRKAQFDLTQEADRRHWLREDKPGEDWRLPDCQPDSGCVLFEITGDVDGLLVRAAAPEHTDKDTADAAVNIRENEMWVIPGSSIKGAVRARAQAIDDFLQLGGLARELFGYGADDASEGKAGELRFEDAYLECDPHSITRIRIDHFTGGVMNGALLVEKPLWGKLRWTISAPDDPAKCALLLFALRDLGLGLYNLGGGGSIGRGYLSNVQISAGGSEILRFEGNRPAAQPGSAMPEAWLRAWNERGHMK